MPFEQTVWRLGDKLTRLPFATIPKELDLESYIQEDPAILDAGWLIIGRQIQSDVGRIDLLALDKSGALVVIELKRDQTTRDVTAQALDYAAWAKQLTSEQVVRIFADYCERYRPQDRILTLDTAFQRKFNSVLPAEELNHSHQIVIVASDLDRRTERVVRYLAERGVEMNILFFQVFADGDSRFLSRVWFLDPADVDEAAAKKGTDAVAGWNGEFYSSFGVSSDSNRSWDEAMKYGFVSAGGGSWYSNTLRLLEPGGRIWVNVPGHGYVGVGEVIGTRQRAADFCVTGTDGAQLKYLDISEYGVNLRQFADDPERAEYFVPVRWIKTVPLSKAVSEVGLFGNQNSVCKPRTAKWQHTVERLKQLFQVE